MTARDPTDLRVHDPGVPPAATKPNTAVAAACKLLIKSDLLVGRPGIEPGTP